jgi:hypothetical protein
LFIYDAYIGSFNCYLHIYMSVYKGTYIYRYICIHVWKIRSLKLDNI